jgi:hypothetical protein
VEDRGGFRDNSFFGSEPQILLSFYKFFQLGAQKNELPAKRGEYKSLGKDFPSVMK